MNTTEREAIDRNLAGCKRMLGLAACRRMWALFVTEQRLYNYYIKRSLRKETA